MKFMMLIKSDKNTEAGGMPDEKILVEMGKYNEELMNAGVLLAAEGLQASVKGARVMHATGKSTIVDGPFAEAKELIAGFWMIQVKSKSEAIEWARRVPFGDNEGEIELRQVFEMSDFDAGDYKSDEARSTLEAEKDFRKRTNS